MFGRKAKLLDAQARILGEGERVGEPHRVNEFAFAEYAYRVEVTLPGEPAFETVARGEACTGCIPWIGDVIAVKVDPEKRTATFDVSHDERFDPVIVAQRHIESAAEDDALYAYLEDHGERGKATVLAVRRGRRRFDNVEVSIDVHVTAKAGDPVDATVVEWIFESPFVTFPEVGQKRSVLFDRADRSKIHWRE